MVAEHSPTYESSVRVDEQPAAPLAVDVVDVDEVRFTSVNPYDPDPKPEVRFVVRGNQVVYSVDGKERPPTRQLLWTTELTTGNQPGRLSMPDIGKYCPLPRDGLARILGGLRCIARAAGVECNIRDAVLVLQGKGQH